jgi:hypothetical protein
MNSEKCCGTNWYLKIESFSLEGQNEKAENEFRKSPREISKEKEMVAYAGKG